MNPSMSYGFLVTDVYITANVRDVHGQVIQKVELTLPASRYTELSVEQVMPEMIELYEASSAEPFHIVASNKDRWRVVLDSGEFSSTGSEPFLRVTSFTEAD